MSGRRKYMSDGRRGEQTSWGMDSWDTMSTTFSQSFLTSISGFDQGKYLPFWIFRGKGYHHAWNKIELVQIHTSTHLIVRVGAGNFKCTQQAASLSSVFSATVTEERLTLRTATSLQQIHWKTGPGGVSKYLIFAITNRSIRKVESKKSKGKKKTATSPAQFLGTNKLPMQSDDRF